MSNIALVHDYFTQQGGAERVAEELYHCLPRPDLFATVAIPRLMPASLSAINVETSWMQRLPQMERLHRLYFAAYPAGVASLKLTDYDLVISSSSSYAKGVHTKSSATHICYCHTPMRWIWRYQDYAAREGFGIPQRIALSVILKGLKAWDQNAALQPDQFIANSSLVAERIREVYKRESVVIHPPIDVDRFQLSTDQDDYYLILSRLVSYKRLDIAIEACNRLNRRLIVIGGGPDRRRLEEIAGPSVKFLGRLSDDEVNTYVSKCRALLFPGEEDFGMTPLEMAAAGKPTVAFRGGGALETIVPGVTGTLFSQQTAESVIGGIEELESLTWSPPALRSHAMKFSKRVFRSRFHSLVNSMGLGVKLTSEEIPLSHRQHQTSEMMPIAHSVVNAIAKQARC
jgi:glycosyltransferase involved in cell wall biosynthesis